MNTSKKAKAVLKKGLPSRPAIAAKRKKKAGTKKASKPVQEKRPPKAVSFTPMQLRVIKMICKQMSSPEIADKLKISSRTVEDYRATIQKKMKVKNVAGMVVYAIKHGIYVVK